MRSHVETPPPAIPYSCFSRQHCAAMSEADNAQEPVADRAVDTTGENSTAIDADAPPGAIPGEYSLHVAALPANRRAARH